MADFLRLTSGCCYYCGRPPAQHWKGSYVYNGVDRLDSSRGYFPDNSVSCCKECNQLKSNYLSPEEMQVVAQSLKNFRATKAPKE